MFVTKLPSTILVWHDDVLHPSHLNDMCGVGFATNREFKAKWAPPMVSQILDVDVKVETPPMRYSIKGPMPSKQLQYGSSEHPIEDLNPFQTPPYLDKYGHYIWISTSRWLLQPGHTRGWTSSPPTGWRPRPPSRGRRPRWRRWSSRTRTSTPSTSPPTVAWWGLFEIQSCS